MDKILSRDGLTEYIYKENTAMEGYYVSNPRKTMENMCGIYGL